MKRGFVSFVAIIFLATALPITYSSVLDLLSQSNEAYDPKQIADWIPGSPVCTTVPLTSLDQWSGEIYATPNKPASFFVKEPTGVYRTLAEEHADSLRDICQQEIGEESNFFVQHSRTEYNKLKEICTRSTGRLEGNYRLVVTSALRNTRNATVCTYQNPLTVDYDYDNTWCNVCGMGNYLNDAPTGERCCTPRHMTEEDLWGNNNPEINQKSLFYTNEDCGKILNAGGEQHICYYDRNPRFEDTTGTGRWLSAESYVGAAISMGCEEVGSQKPHEYLATNEGWAACTPAGFSKPTCVGEETKIDCVVSNTGLICDDNQNIMSNPEWSYMGSERRVLDGSGYQVETKTYRKCASSHSVSVTGEINGVEHTREFLCLTSIAPGKKHGLSSIIECDSTTMSRTFTQNQVTPSGIKRTGTVAKPGSTFKLKDGTIKYCTANSEWVQILANEHVGTGGQICNELQQLPEPGEVQGKIFPLVTGWTGTACCGTYKGRSTTEPLDTTSYTTYNEYYSENPTSPTFIPNTGPIPYSHVGACFNSIFQRNASPLNIPRIPAGNTITNNDKVQLMEVLIIDGAFEGCGIDATWALSQKEDAITCPAMDTTMPAYYTDSKFRQGSFSETSATAYLPSQFGFGSGMGSGMHSNDFLLDLIDSQGEAWDGSPATTSNRLINDNTYCTNIKTGAETYYCSYHGTWKQTPAERTHLSFIPWTIGEEELAFDDGQHFAECCPANHCWNGDTCVRPIEDTKSFSLPSFVEKNSEHGDGFVCTQGVWKWSYKKPNPLGNLEGHCIESTQCYLGPGTSDHTKGPTTYPFVNLGQGVTQPACIDSGQFVGDDYCRDGIWVSRTSLVAGELYNLVDDTDDYTLFCDRFDRVLPHYSYHTQTLQQPERFFQSQDSGERCLSFGRASIPCANNVCVLVKNPNDEEQKIYFGTSLNHNSSWSTINFRPLFGKSLCSGVSGGLSNCGDGIYYHKDMNYVIVSLDTIGGFSYVNIFTGLLHNFIDRVVSAILSRATPETGEAIGYTALSTLTEGFKQYLNMESAIEERELCEDGDCIEPVCKDDEGNTEPVPKLDMFYLANIGDRQVFALNEYWHVDGSPIRYQAAQYKGFERNICDEVFRQHQPIMPNYECSKSDDGTFTITREPEVASKTTDIGSIIHYQQWVYFAPSLRIPSS